MMNHWSITRKKNFALSALGLFTFASVLLPVVRMFIIWLMESFVLRRQLEDPGKWHNLMITWSIRGILFFVIILCCIVFWNQLKQIPGLMRRILESVKERKTINDAILTITSINYRQFIKPVLIMFGLYTLGISAIIRADYSYVDDIFRSIYGGGFTSTHYRYIADFLAVFVYADTRTSDISPLTQLVAAFLIAVSSVALVYVINDNKITKTALAASLPIGLSPYFLECFSWKFDSPFMAMSVFASIVPFIFMKNKLVFFVTSVICILVMCMTYQAASGIYVIIIIFLCFHKWSTRQDTNREVFTFLGISIISYCATLILFRIFVARPVDVSYVSTFMYPLLQIIPGFLRNTWSYLRLVVSDFGDVWKIFLLLTILSFWIKSVVTTKQRKMLVFIASFTVIALMGVLSFGVNLVLVGNLTAPRGMIGFGIFIAILGIYTSISPKRVFALPVFALCWCFFVFSFNYGNALAAQKTYTEFRTEMFLNDLAILLPEKNKEEQLPIQIIGVVEQSPVVSHVAVRNPIISRLVPNHQFNGYWIHGHQILRHYNINFQRVAEVTEEANFEQIFDSMYHTIKSDGERVMVILK